MMVSQDNFHSSRRIRSSSSSSGSSNDGIGWSRNNKLLLRMLFSVMIVLLLQTKVQSNPIQSNTIDDTDSSSDGTIRVEQEQQRPVQQQQKQQQPSVANKGDATATTSDNNSIHNHDNPKNDSTTFPRLENGIYAVRSLSSLRTVLSSTIDSDPYPLLVVLVYADETEEKDDDDNDLSSSSSFSKKASSCPQSITLLKLLEAAIPIMEDYRKSTEPCSEQVLSSRSGNDNAILSSPWSLPTFVKINVAHMDTDESQQQTQQRQQQDSTKSQSQFSTFLHKLSIAYIPSLFFLKPTSPNPLMGEKEMDEKHQHVDDGSNFILDYAGLQSTSEELASGLWHSIYRLRLGRLEFKTMNASKHEKMTATSESSSSSSSSSLEYLDALPMVMQTTTDLAKLLQCHGRGLVRRVPPPLDPNLSPQEIETVRYFLAQDEDANVKEKEPFVVLAQCQSENSQLGEKTNQFYLYQQFEQLSTVLSLRRDVLFLVLQKCPNNVEHGSILLYWVQDDYTDSNIDGNNELILPDHANAIWKPSNVVVTAAPASSSSSSMDPKKIVRQIISNSMTEFVLTAVTPSILWMDRQLTAPIAFAQHFKVHAVLFVDFHHYSSYEQGQRDSNNESRNATQRLIRRVRHACHLHKQDVLQTMYSQNKKQERNNPDDTSTESTMACLIVPSTDTRILTTFGIDIWTPLDRRATFTAAKLDLNQPNVNIPNDDQTGSSKSRDATKDEEMVLPTLLITDQRHPGGGLKRYYLDPSNGIHQPNAVENFIQGFWDNKIEFEYSSDQTKSSTHDDPNKLYKQRMNSYGVQVVTANDVMAKRFPSPRKKHSLLLLYSPTCGHCKRLSIIWNQLAELVKYLEWDKDVEIAKFDVTTNDLVVFDHALVVPWLPDVWYFGYDNSQNRHPIRYSRLDSFGDGVGGVNSPLELIDWLLDVGDFDEVALLKESEAEK